MGPLPILLLAACSGAASGPVDLLAWVDPRIGTGGLGFGVGSASPAATLPAGFVAAGPDTTDDYGAIGFLHCAGYYYDDPWIQAFSHTRMHGIGVPDGGAIGWMPTTEETVDPERYRAPLDHGSEVATPGRYAVALPGVGAVESVAGLRTALHRVRWEGEERWLVLDLAHAGSSDHAVAWSRVEVDPDHATLRGFVLMDGDLTGRSGGLPTWFTAVFDQPFASWRVWAGGEPVEGASAEGRRVAVTLSFERDVSFRIGLSLVSPHGADLNLDREMPDFAYDRFVERAEESWEDWLGRVEVWGGDDEQRRIFATALYHALLMPDLATDVDGRYRGMDHQVHRAAGWTWYTDFSLWDTYRTLHPLVTLLWPEHAADLARSLATMGEQLGYLPRWPAGLGDSGSMVGAPADIVLAESVLKGVDDFPMEDAFARAVAQATDVEAPGARPDLSAYLAYGYVPADLASAASSKTLEYAIADHALARWAEALGERSVASEMYARDRSWRPLFDVETGFMRGRNADGSWTPLDELSWADEYAEGNAWQYTWLVPHDPEGLAEAFGGREALLEKLDRFFALSHEQEDTPLPDPYYWHGNEPDLHAAFLYHLLGRPDAGAAEARWILDTRYGTGPDGLDGNDDGGTLSAWAAFVMLGLYPVNATDRYVVLAPVFDRALLHLPTGTLEILSTGTGPYVAGAWLDGVELDGPVVTHAELTGATRLLVVRSEVPAGWGER